MCPAISSLSDLVNRPITAATTVSSSDHEAWRNDNEGRIANLNDVVADLQSNFAGTSAPTDNAVEGALWADTTNNPAELFFDPDGSGADIRVVMETHTQTLTNKTLTSPTIGGSSFTLSANGWPSFHVHKNGTNQTSVGTADEIISWSTELFDTNDDFASNRFTPTVAGKYLLRVELSFAIVAAGDDIRASIFKNGSEANTVQTQASGSTNINVGILLILDANGTTDYFEAFGANANNADTVIGLATDTFFCGSRIA